MKKLVSIMLVLLSLLLVGCTQDNNEDYTNEEIDSFIEHLQKDLLHLSRGNNDKFDELEVLVTLCDSADTPDDEGGLAETECEDMIEWYAENWEEIYDLLDYIVSEDRFAKELDDYLIGNYQAQIDELKQRIEELESSPHPMLCEYDFVFRVKVKEQVDENIYIVEKYNYTVGGFYQIYTTQQLLIGDITQVAVYENGSAVMFNEIVCVEEGE